MKNAPETAPVREVVQRAAKDWRPEALPGLGVYAGERAAHAARYSDLDEARRNLEFVWEGTGPSRFSDGDWPVLYTAKRIRTCYAEVGYHLQAMYLPALVGPSTAPIRHIQFEVTVAGMQRDFMHLTSEFPSLCASALSRQKKPRQLARKAINDGVDLLRVPSARDWGQTCVPIFSKGSVSPPVNAETFSIKAIKGKTHVEIIKDGRAFKVEVEDRH